MLKFRVVLGVNCQVTPLMEDIYELVQKKDNILQWNGTLSRLDNLPSYPYVQMIGLFLRIYNDGEIMGQIKWLQLPKREGGGFKK